MTYNIYINRENLVESYITYYDSIKCKFCKVDNSESREFKCLVYSIVSDYLNGKDIFDFEYVIGPVIDHIKKFNQLFEFIYNSSFFENGKYKFDMVDDCVKYSYKTNLI